MSTVLEAAFILLVQRPWSTWNIQQRRGEIVVGPSGPGTAPPASDLRHLAPGHALTDGKLFDLQGETDAGRLEVRDCCQSLAEICRDGVIEPSEAKIRRIERIKSETVADSESLPKAA